MCVSRALIRAGLIASLVAASAAYAQWSPSGYTSAVNTPTAETLPMGALLFNWTNNIPEKVRFYPGIGQFGSLGLGMGVIPGVEVSTRLAYDGDLSCNQYASGCRSWTRDLSLNGKVQLPFDLPLNSRIAFGVSDFGGAATNFRQAYVVWTARQGDWQTSVGRASGHSAYALMDGYFGSLVWWASPRARLALEHDSHDVRAGAYWSQPLSDRWRAVGSLSRKLTQERNTQHTQIGVSLVYAWDRDHNTQQAAKFTPSAVLPASLMPQASSAGPSARAADDARSQPPAAQLRSVERVAPDASPSSPPTPAKGGLDSTDLQVRAGALAQAMLDSGFTQVKIGRQGPDQGRPGTGELWWVQANPTAWRKTQSVALAEGIKAIMPSLNDGESAVLALSFASMPHRFIRLRKGCERSGGAQCWSLRKMSFELVELHAPDRSGLSWVVTPSLTQQVQADIEIGPGLRHTAGTEYGLFDYSLAVDTSWEVPVPGVPGLLWQGTWMHPVSHSDDYAPDKVFGSGRLYNRMFQNLLTWVYQPIAQTYVQAAVGYIDPVERGAQLDAAWLSSDARFKLAATTASYSNPRYPFYKFEPQYGQARYELVPGLWALQLTAGRFYYGDQGWLLSSQHWFSNYRLAFSYRQSQSPEAGMPLTKFAGFTISLPLGPERSAQFGPVSLRGRDLWTAGLESKVGANDNYITGGYGVMPAIRHGLNDLLDYDRRLPLDSGEGRRRLQHALER